MCNSDNFQEFVDMFFCQHLFFLLSKLIIKIEIGRAVQTNSFIFFLRGAALLEGPLFNTSLKQPAQDENTLMI
jgi:hypothetical protein